MHIFKQKSSIDIDFNRRKLIQKKRPGVDEFNISIDVIEMVTLEAGSRSSQRDIGSPGLFAVD